MEQTEYDVRQGLSSLARLHEQGGMSCWSRDVLSGHQHDTEVCLPEGLLCHWS